MSCNPGYVPLNADSYHIGGLELVSPIFNFAQRDIWAAHVRSIWLTLQGNFETFPSRQTSTHVHVSPTVAPWATDHVRKIAKAAVYFERCVDSLLPPERYANLWCQSNRYNHLLKGQNMGDIFSWLDQAQTSDHIAYYMCAFSKDSPYGKAMGKQTDFSHNVFRWNFTPLKDRKGTIEFRQPPGSNRGEDTALWISFTIAFVQGAVQHCDKLNPQEAPTLDLLKRLLIGGATASGMKETTLLQNLFAGKKQLAPGAFDLKDASATDLKVMAHKAQEANITLEKFKKLYGYK